MELKEVYSIITNEIELDKYIEGLEDLGTNYKYYISLFARKKYGGTEGLKSDKAQLKRVVASKKMIKKKLLQMEIPVGRYDLDGIPINQGSLVVYISANPRDLHAAGAAAALDMVKTGLSGDNIVNPQAIVMNKIQTIGEKIYFNVDIDLMKMGTMSEFGIRTFISSTVLSHRNYKLVKTRGGFHVLVNLKSLDKDQKKTWYPQLVKLGQSQEFFTVDMSNGDGMLPLPGCTQGGTTPELC
jgi:hypothetical protein